MLGFGLGYFNWKY